MTLFEDHSDGSTTFACVPNELKLMFAEQLGIRDVNALARTCREMNGLLTRIMYRRGKDSFGLGGRSYFLLAVDGGSLAAVERFVEVGAEVNTTDRVTLNPETAIHSCAHFGHVEIAEFLIDKGINVSAVDRYNHVPLHTAMVGVCPKEAMVTFLVKAGVDVDACSHCHRTPLHMAALAGNVRIARRLLDLGADPNAADSYGRRPVHLAAAYDAATVRCLLGAAQNPAIVDDWGETPLHFAAEYGPTNCVKELLEMGADVSSVDWRGRTPLHMALHSYGNEATAHRIIQLDASKTYTCVPGCRSNLTTLTIHNKIEMLLAAGADITKRNIDGDSPLSWAASNHIHSVTQETVIPKLRVGGW